MKSLSVRILVFAAAVVLATQMSSALGIFQVQHTLTGVEGANPSGGLVRGSDDNFYGTAHDGGQYGTGTIFRLPYLSNSIQPLFDFPPSDLHAAAGPSSLMRGRDNFLYGTTDGGGEFGAGTIFKLNPDGTGFQILHSFNCAVGNAPGTPYGMLTEGPDGALYGVTNPNRDVVPACTDLGSLFKVNKDGTGFQSMFTFEWSVTGAVSWGPVVVAQDGSVFGTMKDSNNPLYQWGGVFKVSPSGEFTLLHSFNGTDGTSPAFGLIRGEDGALYGTTLAGGSGDVGDGNGGTIFRITEDGQFTSLYSFTPSSLFYPSTLLVSGGDGKLYGGAGGGGDNGLGGTFIFDLATRQLEVHHAMNDTPPFDALGGTGDGNFLTGNLTVGPDHHLYGASAGGGSVDDQGTLFGLLDITVTNRAPFPVATASPNPAIASVVSGATVTLSAAGSWDPDFDALSYVWTLPAGTSIVSGTINSVTLDVKFPIGSKTVGLQVSDGTDTVPTTLNVIVKDLPPTLSPVVNLSAPATSASGAVVNYTTPTATDVIDGTIPVSCLPVPGATFAVGTTTVTCSATDSSSNTVTSSFTITVTDAVSVHVPSNTIIEANAQTGASAGVVTFTASASSLASPSLPVACLPASGSAFGFGTTTVTCTASDSFGNSGSASFDVLVRDTTPPALIVPGDITVTATSSAGAAVLFAPPVASATPVAVDIVDGVRLVTCVPPSGTTFPLGSTTVICHAFDLTGNASNGSFNVVVTSPSPIVTVPANLTPEATNPTGATVTFAASATDTVEGPLSVTCLPGSGSVFLLDVPTQVSCSATNSKNLTTTSTFTVTVKDTTGPFVYTHGVIQPSNTTGGNVVIFQGPGVTVGPDEVPYATDIVDGASLAVTCLPPSGSLFPLGVTHVACSATDAHGNKTISTTEFIISDNGPPVLHMPANIIVDAQSSAGATVPFVVTATDQTDPNPIVTCSFTSPHLFPLGITAVTCSAVDHSGNSSGPASFTVNVSYLVHLVVPSDITVEATSLAGAMPTFAATASNFLNPVLPVSCTPASGATFALGTTAVGCTAHDALGNTASASFNVIVRDTIAPVLTVPGNISASPTGPSGAAVVFTPAPFATDLADAAPAVLCAPASGTTFPVGSTSVSCTATDASHNTSAPQTFLVTVGNSAPVINVPGNLTPEATEPTGAIVTYAVSATDSVDGPVLVSCVLPSGSHFPLDLVTTVDCSATNSANVTTHKSFTIKVVDTTGPVVHVHGIIQQSNTLGGAIVRFLGPGVTVLPDEVPFATDLVDVDIAHTAGLGVSCTPASGFVFPVGTSVLSCSATDAHGNHSTATTEVIITDGDFPVLHMPANMVVEATSASGATVSFSVTATDATDPNPSVNCSYTSPALFHLGANLVSCTAIDHSLHQSDPLQPHTLLVTVVDTTPPAIPAMLDIVRTTTNPLGLTVTYTVPTATDLVNGLMPVVCLPPSGLFPVGTTTVACTSVDLNLPVPNTSTVRFTVTVTLQGDTTAPVITVPADITKEATGSTGAMVTYTASALDAVDGVRPVTCVPGSGSTFPLGTTEVKCTAIDVAGNVATKTFKVIVKDTTPPVITVPADITVLPTSGSGAVVTFTTSAVDLVNGSRTVTCVPGSGSTFPVGTTEVKCTAADASGNSATKTFKVTVKDTVAPVITVPADITKEAAGSSGAAVTFTVTAVDAVNGTRPVTCVPASGSTFPLGTTIVTCTAADLSGNSASKTFKVTVKDTVGPVITVPADIVTVSTSSSGAYVSFTTSAADLVSGNRTVTCMPASGAKFPIATTTVTCKATDAAGNQSTKTFKVTVVAKPTLTVSLSPGSLWPPNHRMVNITASITASAGTMVKLISITSSEPDNGLGDGDTPDDIQGETLGADDRAFQVRAERRGNGPGRVYTVVYRATNTLYPDIFVTVVDTVVVPHDQHDEDDHGHYGNNHNDDDHDHDHHDGHECDGSDGHDTHKNDYRGR